MNSRRGAETQSLFCFRPLRPSGSARDHLFSSVVVDRNRPYVDSDMQRPGLFRFILQQPVFEGDLFEERRSKQGGVSGEVLRQPGAAVDD